MTSATAPLKLKLCWTLSDIQTLELIDNLSYYTDFDCEINVHDSASNNEHDIINTLLSQRSTCSRSLRLFSESSDEVPETELEVSPTLSFEAALSCIVTLLCYTSSNQPHLVENQWQIQIEIELDHSPS